MTTTHAKEFKAPTLEELTTVMNMFFERQEQKGFAVKVSHSHQIQIGEAEARTVGLNGQPQIKYFFVIILFYSLIPVNEKVLIPAH